VGKNSYSSYDVVVLFVWNKHLVVQVGWKRRERERIWAIDCGMSLLDAWKTAFYHSSSYITQPIGDKSHEILCKLEDIQKKKLESVRNASAPLPLGMKNETRDEHTSTPTTTAEARKKILAKYGFIN